MRSSNYLPNSLKGLTRAMVFVDGENLTLRYQDALAGAKPEKYVHFLQDVYVWSRFANIRHHMNCEVIRKYYYTVVQGDELKIEEIEVKLKEIGIEAPRVFKKQKGRSTKRVDITIATDMLTHAHRGNYDLAILVSGDEDYVPLVRAVKDEGCRVVLWFFWGDPGLSNKLVMEADYFFDISNFLRKPEDEAIRLYQS